MNYLITPLLDNNEIQIFKSKLNNENEDWQDGKKTAGSHAAKVKNNLQLKRECETSKSLSKFITNKILSNPLIKSFSLPKRIHGIMFTKSRKGMQYGRHIDNAFMSSGRADLSFTIFINEKDSYQGGELIVENINSESTFKLNSGEIIIYPSTYLHSVNEINFGERLVCVGWMQSYIKSTEEREYPVSYTHLTLPTTVRV